MCTITNVFEYLQDTNITRREAEASGMKFVYFKIRDLICFYTGVFLINEGWSVPDLKQNKTTGGANAIIFILVLRRNLRFH